MLVCAERLDGAYSRVENKARSVSRGSESSQDPEQRNIQHGNPDPGRVRSGSKGSKSSHGSRTSKTYYFGESPDPSSNGAEDTLNTSMEGATPHKGEVVRIKVPFQDGEGGPDQEGILREDKEISPRYNGHKVTIQVYYTHTVYKVIFRNGLGLV